MISIFTTLKIPFLSNIFLNLYIIGLELYNLMSLGPLFMILGPLFDLFYNILVEIGVFHAYIALCCAVCQPAGLVPRPDIRVEA